MPEYDITLYSNTGAWLADLTKRLTHLSWSRVVNDVGHFELTFSDENNPIDIDLFQLNSRVVIHRKAAPFAMSRLECIGFVRAWDYSTDERGVTRFTFSGPDQNDLLKIRTGAPFHNGFWGPTIRNYIDAFMRELVDRHWYSCVGVSYDAARDIVTSNGAGLTLAVEPSTTATQCTTAGIIEANYAGRNLLEYLQWLHYASREYKQTDVGTAAVRVYFDVVPDTDNAWTFRCFANRRGMNRRADSGNHLPIGLSHGNLKTPRWEYDRSEEINAGMGLIFAQSYSTSWWYLDTARIGDAPLNRREASRVTNEDTGAEASGIVAEGKPKPKFTGRMQDTPNCRYGIDWGFGDEVTIDYLGKQHNAHITGINVDFYGGWEKLEPTFEVETP